MYEKLNMTENHLQILELYTRGYDKEYYIREVQHILKISPRTAQLILDDLEKKGILESETRGKIRTYKLRKNFISNNYMVLCEQYKKISFISSNPKIRELMDMFLGHVHGIAAIFGSYAKGMEKKESDLDVLIVGTYEKKEVNKASKLLDIEANVKIYPQKIFMQEARTDILLKEVLENHIIISGAESFVKTAMR